MPTANRTGDEEGRIVHGGELPEGDNSLDDVVVDKPGEKNPNPVGPRKNPNELWTSYLARRLADEGIYLGEFDNDEKGTDGVSYSCLIHRLNSGLLMLVSRHFGLDKLKAVACSTRAGSLFYLSEIIDSEYVSLSFGKVGLPEESLSLHFDYSRNTATADFFDLDGSPASSGFRQRPFICNYEQGKSYSAEQVITDLVNYIKETGIKR